MKITSAGISHIGNVRKNNEDNLYINGNYREETDEEVKVIEDSRFRLYHTYAVCDGMGGESYGEAASLKTVQELCEKDSRNFRKNLESFITETNKQVCNIGRNKSVKQVGTTLALIAISGKTADICNIGDSRIYRLRNDKLSLLSKDHTQAQDLIDAGIISAEEAEKDKKKHVLTQHLGIPEDEFIIEPYIKRNEQLVSGDIYLLCSDGLTDMVTSHHIEKIVIDNKNQDVRKIAMNLLTTALSNGGKDNTTVVVVKIN